MKRVLDVSKARSIGCGVKTALQDGLRETYA